MNREQNIVQLCRLKAYPFAGLLQNKQGVGNLSGDAVDGSWMSQNMNGDDGQSRGHRMI
jgi:hypothetical protein